MNHFVLNFSEIKTLLELHQYLKEVFSLPDYYGNNMDALWDCLSCCYNENTTIELRNFDVLRKRMEQTAKTMLEVFQDLHDEDGVIIEIVEVESDHPKKRFDTVNDELSGYMIQFDAALSKLAKEIFENFEA